VTTGPGGLARWSADSEKSTLCSCRSPTRGTLAAEAGAHTGFPSPSDPFATTMDPHFLQRIFTIFPRTFSSAILYRAWHV